MSKLPSVIFLVLAGAACASRSPSLAPSPEAERCYAISDSLSKYVSVDALPLAHISGNPTLPRSPGTLGAADSVYVEFPVTPDGVADTTALVVTGTSNPEFVRSVSAFASQARFVPAQIAGCNVISKYNLTVRPRG
jgi:outer membrane biosynthesis protein TonB